MYAKAIAAKANTNNNVNDMTLFTFFIELPPDDFFSSSW
jgi:hypothetical protein